MFPKFVAAMRSIGSLNRGRPAQGLGSYVLRALPQAPLASPGADMLNPAIEHDKRCTPCIPRQAASTLTFARACLSHVQSYKELPHAGAFLARMTTSLEPAVAPEQGSHLDFFQLSPTFVSRGLFEGPAFDRI